MILSRVSEIVFLQIALGTALSLIPYERSPLGKGFFVLNGILAFVAALLSLLFHYSRIDLPKDMFGFVIAVMACLLLLFSLGVVRNRADHKPFLALAAAVLLGLFALSHESRSIAPPVLTYGFLELVLRYAALVLGGYLLGFALVSMNLGHWYLISKGLSFDHLLNAARIFVALVLLRTVFAAASLLAFRYLPGDGKVLLYELFSPEGYILFFLMRVLWGLIGPLILGVLIYRCVEIHSNTSATGLMYVVLVTLLIGEPLASYIAVLTAIPL